MIQKKIAKAIHILVIFLCSCVITGVFWLLSRDTLGLSGNEFFIYEKNPFEWSNNIVIVKVDNTSLDELQKSDLRVLQLNKTIFARVIEKLFNANARVVWIDIVFANDAPDVDILANQLLKYPNIVIGAKIGLDESERVLPLDVFSGTSWGMIDMPRHGATVSRITPGGFMWDTYIESLSLAMYRKYSGIASGIPTSRSDIFELSPLTHIPLIDGKIRIPFFYEPYWYPSYSLIDVLRGNVWAEVFSGKIVLIWEHGTLIHDAFPAPIRREKDMPGVEFHAHMLDALLTDTYIQDAPNFSLTWLTLLFLSGIFFTLRLRWGITLLFFTLIWYIIFSRFLFGTTGYLIDVMMVLSGCIITCIVTLMYRYFFTEKDRRFIEHAFSHYIAPEVVKSISQNPKKLQLGGEKKDITILFSDIAWFTKLSEELGTEKLFDIIGRYLSEMTDILTHHHGTLDKYIGDAMMWFFWAPIELSDSNIRACQTALEQQERLSLLMKQWMQEGVPQFSVRIWINRWEAMVWNIWSKKRFNYTVMGDTVNIASRLEAINKEYGTLICVSASVVADTNHIYDFRKLDTIRVKWKDQSVDIYELLGKKGTKTSQHHIYENALLEYLWWNYKKAITLFATIKEGDPPARTLLKRSEYLIANNISLEGGVWTMETK
jgi:class 3 adenylate cyclase/CHASE2 domain-containing sensor protein